MIRQGAPLLLLIFILSLVFVAWNDALAASAGKVPHAWELAVPSADCASTQLGRDCHISSPALADIDGDGRLDIILATNSGHLLAVNGDGQVLWDTDTSPFFDLPADSQSFASSPAVADLDGDDVPEVVVGAGSLLTNRCYPGGVVVLNGDGQLRAGWPRRTFDNEIPPAQCPDPVYSTPALGDLDGDGDLEIVVGAFDTRVYAWHDDGRPVQGFPPPSKFHLEQGWPNVAESLADTVWSSPALADVDGDGATDIVIGSDEGMLGPQPGGGVWKCPYRPPWEAGNEYCGGTFYAWDGRGKPLAGYPKRLLETIQSSPIVIDADFDSQPEVFVGSGSFYHNNSADKPTHGFAVFGWDGAGSDLPGWAGGLPTGGTVSASAAAGDIAGDEQLEIIIPARDGLLYAYHPDGSPVDGFPMAPIDLFGKRGDYDFNKNPLLADYDGDGKMEIFVVTGWSISIVDGDGTMITNVNFPTDQATPFYYMDGLLMNNPAIGDVDGDDEPELVAYNSRLRVWDLPDAAGGADWPMFRHNAARAATLLDPSLRVFPNQLDVIVMEGQAGQVRLFLDLSVNGVGYRWSASESSGDLSLPITSGVSTGTQRVAVDVRISAGRPLGDHALGEIAITASGEGADIRNGYQTVPVTLTVIPGENRIYAPLIAYR